MTIYEKRFNKESEKWCKDVLSNAYFIENAILYFDDILRNRGYVFLKDIYEYMGLPITRDSIIVGWYRDNFNKHVDISYEKINETDFMLKFKTDGIILTCFN